MTRQEKAAIIESRRDKVVQLYTIENKSINQIAKELGISWDSVKNDLVKRNVIIQSVRNQYGTGNGVNSDLFKQINNADAAYWLGFLYADGNIRVDRNEISLELQEKDKKAIEDFHKYCGNNNSIREHKLEKNNKTYVSYVSSFSSEQVKQNLINLGCVPKKSLILTFPDEKQLPQEFIYDFIRGYIDGDGYIQYDYDKHRYRIIILGTKEFLNGLIRRLNLMENYAIYQDTNSFIYNLTLSNKESVFELLTKLYENSKYHLERKFKIYEEAKLGR